jgi:hypothetical protein
MPPAKITYSLLGLTYLILILCFCFDQTMTIDTKIIAGIASGLVPLTGVAIVRTIPD